MPLEVERIDLKTSFLFQNVRISLLFITICTRSKLAVVNGLTVERGSSVGECPTRNQVSPGSNPALLPRRRLGIFVLSIDAPGQFRVQVNQQASFRKCFNCGK